jgi:glycosyltransferase involved in cell wall biosynthesis
VPQGLSVCILSRKDLSRVTRVVRQAKALTDAGHRVTVVCVKRPMDELVLSAPAVEYVEVPLEPWTRRLVIARRQLAQVKRSREVRAQRAVEQARAGGAVSVGQRARAVALGVRRSLRRALERGGVLVLALPTAVLVRVAGEPLWSRTREIATLSPLGLLQLYLPMFAQHANTLSFAANATGALEGRRFDVCQAHDNFALVAAAQLARASGARLLYDAIEISEHRQGHAGRRSLLRRATDRWERRREARIIRRADAMMTIGEGLADWYAARHRIARPLVVRNCRYFRPDDPCEDIRRDCGVEAHERLVVWFGYAYPEQGLEALVQAMSLTRSRAHLALIAAVAPRWEAFLAGLVGQAEALGLAERVHVLPPRAPNDLIRYASGADAGLIPLRDVTLNIRFCMPNKLMEMIMARLPVGVSELPDMVALVSRYDIGTWFDPEEPASIARAIDDLLEPANHRRLRANTDAAASDLSWERESRPYLSLFERWAAEVGVEPPEAAPSLTRGSRRLHPDVLREHRSLRS